MTPPLSQDSLCNYTLSEAARQESRRDVDRVRPSLPLPLPILPTNPFLRQGLDSPLPARFDSPNPEALEAVREQLSRHSGRFRELAVALVTQLGQAPDLDMRFLAVRLNFNFAFGECLSLLSGLRSSWVCGRADGVVAQ